MSLPILVTGGAGFLGSHLCRRLLADRYEVICLDNFITGNKQNVDRLIRNPMFKLIDHNIWEPISLEVEQIFNMACPASPVAYQRSPVATVKTAVLGAMNMLDLAKESKARIFQASTSENYGDPLEHPQNEQYRGNVNPIGPRACYDEGKRCAETIFFDYQRQYHVDIRVGRIFNTYGPNMQINDGRVISNFIVQALQNKTISIYGDGQQTRSFCFVDDLIEGILAFMHQDDGGMPVNIGNSDEITILKLAELVCEYTGSKSQIEFLKLPEDDPIKRQPSTERIKSLTGWEAKVSLEDGLKETIRYFNSCLYK